ncbi:DNA topoisomerase, partial [Nowakowskiella sp. JEL0078]
MVELQENLENLSRQSQILVIWTDCDREGENIGSEVVDICRKANPTIQVKRARFSVIQPREIKIAWNSLIELDYLQAIAVDARSELDLRIGAAFTRFQTLQLQNKFAELNKKVLSYGSCQFPTLGFVVDQYKKSQEFISEQMWRIDVVIEKDKTKAKFTWSRSHLFDQHCCLVLYDKCVENPTATITKIIAKPTEKWKPLPLTTVELQKVGSRFLRMSSDQVMTIADKLYNKGYLSYPRTETDIFDDNFQLRPLIEKQAQDGRWGPFAQNLLNGGFRKPRKGKHNDKAHPPIHPTRDASGLQGDEQKIYEFVTRRFLACCSENAKGHETTVEIKISDEQFSVKGLMILERNYLEVYVYDKWSDSSIPTFVLNEQILPSVLEMNESQTTAPPLLTEADLITLMDKSGIGTDATIHEHIKKILDREYVVKEGDKFCPTTLGMALVEGYDSLDIEVAMSKPYLRSQMELNMKSICEGTKTKDEVVQFSLLMYREVFEKAVEQSDRLELKG